MKNNLFLCVCALCITSLMYCDSLQDLKKMIMTSDLEAVEKLVPTLEVDQQTKDSLVTMAHDVVIMRLNKMKTWELTRFKIVDLPAEVSKKIDEKTKYAAVGLLLGVGIYTFGIVKLYKPIIAELVFGEKVDFTEYDNVAVPTCVALVGCLIAAVSGAILDGIRKNSIIEFAHKRFNQLYENSIQIKQLMYTLKVVS
ncbi:MAG TPA: hypothetical protein PKD74_04075 [Candidatus Dependentiae bacterium]|nr:hypothetical protein [Candidatus Dependentiae bacterium]